MKIFKKTPFAIFITSLLALVLICGMTPGKKDSKIQDDPGFRYVTLGAGHTDALLLTCMDYRLIGNVTDYMQHHSMKEKYDQVILAGASLGVNNTTYPNWGETFWQHLSTAIALHSIHEVIIMDHRNCGAYKLLLKQDFPADANADQLKEEKAVHKEQLDNLARAIHEKYANLDVETLLMSLDGSVEGLGYLKGSDATGDKH
jgi:carbonic anhydrase